MSSFVWIILASTHWHSLCEKLPWCIHLPTFSRDRPSWFGALFESIKIPKPLYGPYRYHSEYDYSEVNVELFVPGSALGYMTSMPLGRVNTCDIRCSTWWDVPWNTLSNTICTLSYFNSFRVVSRNLFVLGSRYETFQAHKLPVRFVGSSGEYLWQYIEARERIKTP